MDRTVLSRTMTRSTDPNIERERDHPKVPIMMRSVTSWSRVLQPPAPRSTDLPILRAHATLPMPIRQKLRSDHWGTQSAPSLPLLSGDPFINNIGSSTASPTAVSQSNRGSSKQDNHSKGLTRPMMRSLYHQWMESFNCQSAEFTSTIVWAELVLVQVIGATSQLPSPNLLRTAVCSFLLDKITPNLGQYSHVVSIIKAELYNSIYVGYNHDLTHIARTPRPMLDSLGHVPESCCYVDMELHADRRASQHSNARNGKSSGGNSEFSQLHYTRNMERMLQMEAKYYRQHLIKIHFRAWKVAVHGAGSTQQMYVRNIYHRYLSTRYFRIWTRFVMRRAGLPRSGSMDSAVSVDDITRRRKSLVTSYAHPNDAVESAIAVVIDRMTLESVLIKWANVMLEGVRVLSDFEGELDNGEALSIIFSHLFPDVLQWTSLRGVGIKEIFQAVVENAIVKGMPLGLVTVPDMMSSSTLRTEMRIIFLYWLYSEWYVLHKSALMNGSCSDEHVSELSVALDIGMRYSAWETVSAKLQTCYLKRVADRLRGFSAAAEAIGAQRVNKDDIPKEAVDFTTVSELSLMDELRFARIIDTSAEVREINRVLNLYAVELRKVFMFYSGLSDGASDMNRAEFWRFVEDTKLSSSRNLTKQALEASFRKTLSRGGVETKELNGNRFVELLAKIAAISCAGSTGVRGSVATALDAMIRNDIVPKASSSEKEDFKQAVRQQKMQDALSQNSKTITRWFTAYAKKVDSIDCISLKAFLQFVTDMGWIDNQFTKSDANLIFKAVQEADDEAGDAFMDRTEFQFAIVAIGMHKVSSPLISSANRVNQFFADNAGVRVRTMLRK